ncbi:hypothetical protein BMETH_525_1 [methanotrophic bacterial endosymbiont of Bathymodiolus sp.]|nr:hypothetical protein BMETH_525_1 [methanotrophic bacterial endosymbiont of Bathymodiolus sp.]
MTTIWKPKPPLSSVCAAIKASLRSAWMPILEASFGQISTAASAEAAIGVRVIAQASASFL